jgi:HEAT repeat protein
LDDGNNMTDQALLSKAVAAVAGELNIARRVWAAYPHGHPMVEAALNKLLSAWHNLLQQQSPVQIGITRDGLLLGEEYVEKRNSACSSVAAALFERGAGTLLVRQKPRLEELQVLLRLMTMKREDVQAGGGIEKIWENLTITFMKIRGIRYDRFSVTEEAVITSDSSQDRDTAGTGSVWERFVRLMMQGVVGLSGTDASGDVRPEVLAATLNASFARRMGTGSGLSSGSIRNPVDVMREFLTPKAAPRVTNDNQSDTLVMYVDSSESAQQAKIHAFIAALDPALRRQILNGFYETGNDADRSVAEMLFRQLGPAMLQDTYAKAEEFSAAHPLLQGILRKLLPHMSGAYETSTPHDEIRDKVRTLLEEHRQEVYVPDEYLLELQILLAEEPLPQIEKHELRELLLTVEPAAIEIGSSEIIMQLVLTDPDGVNTRDLIQNLTDLCGYFLELGDYGQVLKILRQAADPGLPPRLRIALRDAFSQPDFLDEILSGLTVWGKPKYDQVTQLIRIIGRPFIEPLLDRLAVEENMSLRRFLVDRVLGFGDAARPALVVRLTDPRWYVLRNIVSMLRTLAPGQETHHLRPLLNHSNQKVRHEVVKSLLLAGDPIAQRQLLRDLDSNNPETRLGAIHLVDGSGSLEMARKLTDMLSVGGYSPDEYKLKLACVKALAEIGRVEVLPELAKLLGARSMLAYKTLNHLKVDTVRTFERYPAGAVLPLLERFASGNDAVAIQAAETLKTVRSRIS